MPPPPPKKKKKKKKKNNKKSTISSFIFLKYWTQNNVPNLRMKISESNTHPWDRHCHRRTHDWTSVTLYCQYLTNNVSVRHVFSFKENNSNIHMYLKKYSKISKPHYNIIMTYYTACLQHDIQLIISFATHNTKQFMTPLWFSLQMIALP